MSCHFAAEEQRLMAEEACTCGLFVRCALVKPMAWQEAICWCPEVREHGSDVHSFAQQPSTNSQARLRRPEYARRTLTSASKDPPCTATLSRKPPGIQQVTKVCSDDWQHHREHFKDIGPGHTESAITSCDVHELRKADLCLFASQHGSV